MALKLFWWNDIPNFGDRISEDISTFVSGQKVEWAKPFDAELIAVGSIMFAARRSFITGTDVKPWVWGTGAMKPIRKDFVEHTHFAAVRGPITREFLGIDVEAYGDPGLLMPFVLKEKFKSNGKIGIIPHISKIEKTKALVEKLEGKAVLISPSEDDHLDVVRQIAACSCVFSSSLHGLIVADSFGVPNTWLDPTGNHPFDRLKFYDYAAGVGRALPLPIKLEEIADKIEEGVTPITYGDGVMQAQKTIFEAFPDALKGANAPKFDENWYSYTRYVSVSKAKVSKTKAGTAKTSKVAKKTLSKAR